MQLRVFLPYLHLTLLSAEAGVILGDLLGAKLPKAHTLEVDYTSSSSSSQHCCLTRRASHFLRPTEYRHISYAGLARSGRSPSMVC